MLSRTGAGAAGHPRLVKQRADELPLAITRERACACGRSSHGRPSRPESSHRGRSRCCLGTLLLSQPGEELKPVLKLNRSPSARPRPEIRQEDPGGRQAGPRRVCRRENEFHQDRHRHGSPLVIRPRARRVGGELGQAVLRQTLVGEHRISVEHCRLPPKPRL
jgi:hypothetical protein